MGVGVVVGGGRGRRKWWTLGREKGRGEKVHQKKRRV